MRYSPTQALNLLQGITRKRLYEMMGNGTLSYSLEDKKRFIDGTELARVFNGSFHPEKPIKTFSETEKKQNETPETDIENRLLKQKIESLQERLADKERENTRIWEKLEAETQERRKLTMLLTDMRQKPPEKPVQKQKGFFDTLISKKWFLRS